MKIFISYGHQDHTQVVDMLFDALVREGHEPWKDDRYEGNSGISAGQDFTEVIYQAIDDADFVVAFVTKQTADKPYCRDERQRAYNKKGSRFIQIRMDYADITLGNARSYIDMSDVISSNGQINNRLFEEKLAALFAAFRDPNSFAEGGFTPWAKFDTHLKVQGALRHQEFIAALDQNDFVGRQWLLEKCKNWVMDETIPFRLFVILGEAGTGKTAFVRRLASDEELVRSVHICIYDKPSTRTARDTLKDLAYVLAQNNKEYFEFLKMRNLEQIQDMTVDGMFEFLFIEPLKTEKQKYLLIIDGLDEMEENSGFKPLMRLFRQYAQQLNPNISFLVTGRPDAYILDMLKTVAQGKELESVLLDKNASKEDLQCFIEGKLHQHGCYSESLADKLLEACDGNFEYLSLLFREVAEEGLQVFDGMKIPRGLNERYAQYLDRRMEIVGSGRLSREQRQLLSVLCAAYEPLTVSVLSAVTGLDEYDITDELELFGSLIRRIDRAGEDTKICLFTKSFRDFLLSKSFEKYSADQKLGVRLISQHLINKCGSEKALKKHPYLDEYGFVHLLRYAIDEADEVADYCKELEVSGVDIAQRIAKALHHGETAAIQGYWEIKEEINQHNTIIRHLKGKRSATALEGIVSQYEQEQQVASALILKADMLLWNPSPEVYTQVQGLFENALVINEQRHKNNPCHESFYDLSTVYVRLGDLERRKQTLESTTKAQDWYLKKLSVDEQYDRTYPSYESRRNLSITYNRLSDAARAKQTPEGFAEAKKWALKQLEMNEQNHKANPSYESYRDVGITYGRIGVLAKLKQTPEGFAEAEEWFLKKLEIDEQNYKTNGGYENCRDLSSIYNQLGDLAKAKQTPEGDAKAEEWYLKKLDIDEQNCRANPCYESRSDLAITYERLGDLEYLKQTPEGKAKAEEWYLKKLDINEQNCQINPCYESRRGVAIIYGRLGDLARMKQTPEGNAEAEEWYLKQLSAGEQNYGVNPGYESRRDLSVVYERLGDLARVKQTPEGNAKAEEWYLKKLDIDKQNYGVNPGYESRRDLALIYGRLGDLLRLKQTPEENARAEEWYLKQLDLNEQNYSANPCYQSRRDLAITCGRLGDLSWIKQVPDRKEQAEKWHLKAAELYSQNNQSSSCYESRLDLSIVCGRLGVIMWSKNTPEGNARAEEWFLKKTALDEENNKEKPSYNIRRDLSITYSRLGSLSREKKTLEGNAEAYERYLKKVAFDEQDYEAFTTYDSRRDLAISYGYLGDLARAKRTPDGDAKAEEWFLKKLSIDEKNYSDNQSYESRRDLALTHGRLGDIAFAKQTPEMLVLSEKLQLKAFELYNQNYTENPNYDSRRDLAITYSRLGDLVCTQQTSEATDWAEQMYLKALGLYSENYQTGQNNLSKNDMAFIYQRLARVAVRKNTPEGHLQAEQWMNKRQELLNE